MTKKKPAKDVNVTAFEVLQAATEMPANTLASNRKPVKRKDQSGKNPAAVSLGRLGGLKGGKARAEKLSSEERVKIAKKAANTRWRSS